MPGFADMSRCRLCPRACDADREGGGRGACGETAQVRLARAALHEWEEPPISGNAGSGTVFFSGCPLRCVYCQNREISTGEVGKKVSLETLARIFLEQQARGALNVNLVTPTHFAPQIAAALALARSGKLAPRAEMLPDGIDPKLLGPQPLRLPVVYNTSGYELPAAIEALDGFVDVYLTDFKYASRELAQRYSDAPDYPAIASVALDAMYASAGPCRIERHDDEEVLVGGVVVRHLMLPGHLEDSKRVIEILAAKPYADRLVVSLMSQYTPLDGVGERFPELSGTVCADEYDELIDYALDLGLEHSYMQEGGAAAESFIPAFDYQGV